MLQAGVLGRPRAVRGAPGPVVRVVMVLNAAVRSDASLLRGDMSGVRRTGLPRVLHETCGGGRTSTRATPICARTGTLLKFVVGLVTVRDVAVTSHVLLRLGVASERAVGDGAPPARASRNEWRRTHESDAATICARTGALLGLWSA